MNIENKSNDLKITYPWITVELIPWTKKFYEVVWNCWGLSVAISAIENKNANKETLEMVLNIFESVRKVNNQIIFVTDNSIFQKQKDFLNGILKEIFWDWNFRIVWIENISREKNAISWLQINRTWFSDDNEVIKAIAELPNATVLSSIPKSDPRINHINEKINGFKNTIAWKTLQLLDLNSKKSNQIDIAWEHIWYLWFAKNVEELESIFNKNEDKILVIKDDAWTAWGTSVNFISNKEQRKSILENKNINYPVVIYEFLEPTLISDLEWRKYPIQFRPYLNNDGRIMGWTLKFPNIPLWDSLFSNWWWKWSFEKQNKTLNTSSWLTNTIFIWADWNPIHSYIVWEKWFNSLAKKETEEFLSNFKLVKTQKWLSLWEEVLEISQIITPILREMQEKTNNLLKL